MTPHVQKIVEVLLVEDDPGVAALADAAFHEAEVVTRLTHITDGAKAWRLLNLKTADGRAYRPDLVILDLSLPGMGGMELLEAVKNHPALARVPVIVLTRNAPDEVVTQCYRLRANSLIEKPEKPKDMVRLIRAIEKQWLIAGRIPLRYS